MKKTEYIIDHQSFGKRRIWEDDEGFFFVVNNITYRTVHEGSEEFDVYKATRVSDKKRLSE